MSEKNKLIEYTADYRTPDKKIKSSVSVARTYEKKEENKISIDPNKTIDLIKKGEKTKLNQHNGTIKISKINKKQFKIYQIFFAVITMALTVVGAIILVWAINRTSSVISDSSTYTKYNNYIAPVVMHDPKPFNDISEASSDFIISSSIWRNIFQNGIEHYKDFDEQGLTLISVSEIQNAAIDLFGPSGKINTKENIFGPFYSYTSGEENFHISTISNLGTFVPYIEEMIEKDDELMLKVSYLSREDKFLSVGKDKADLPTPVKQMIYILKINSDTNKYYIAKIENK